ncbi:hypothetical protein K474DRAFT_1703644 [Panus rudis PR-1116 ss-1]|nr:hypothetical protein K474DRAFT_1703644 [Panus rudis PR-1116 ss-1]
MSESSKNRVDVHSINDTSLSTTTSSDPTSSAHTPISIQTPNPPAPLQHINRDYNYSQTPNDRQPISPLTHILILTSILTPIGLLPYLAVRRHLLTLSRKLSEISSTNASLQRDFRNALLEASVRREEHDRLRRLVEEQRREVLELREVVRRGEVREREVGERVRTVLEEVEKLREESRTKETVLRELGVSLADVAAFMHEVEVQHPLATRKQPDGRGIERIRQLAYKFQNLQGPPHDTPSQKRE